MIRKYPWPWVVVLFSLLLRQVAGASRPNILFVMSDDQDLHMNSLSVMPNVNRLLGQGGTFYQQHYCTVALCCPSRVNLLTGKAAHNTNVTDLGPPYGGYPKFISQGFNDNHLPVWLQAAGYNTYYVGKLMNSHDIQNYDKPFVNGFNHSSFLLEPYTYQYFNTTWTDDQSKKLMSNHGTHTTNLTTQKALAYIEDAAQANEPFFMMVAPIGPHVELLGYGKNRVHAPVPQAKYADAFADETVPRTPNFNPDSPSGVGWVKTLPQQNQTVVDANDELYRARLRVVAGLDDMVNDLVTALDQKGILDSTYMVYTTDNGYHIGQHRMQPGKRCGYETDINIPLFIRGPGVPAGVTTNISSSHTDLAPTFFQMLDIPLRPDFDGTPIPTTADSIAAQAGAAEHVNVEFWGIQDGGEGTYGSGVSGVNNTYKAMRVFGPGYSFYYAVWCSNEHELYDMQADPYQMNNLYSSTRRPQPQTPVTLLGMPAISVVNRLDALLLVLKSCAGSSCAQPWTELHPSEDVKTLTGALNTTYDDFYESQPKVTFEACDMGYLPSKEGAQKVMAFNLNSRETSKAAGVVFDGRIWVLGMLMLLLLPLLASTWSFYFL